MPASTRFLIWLAVLLVGLLPLIPDPEEAVPAAASAQLAVWEDSEPEARSLRGDLTHPHANLSLLHSWGPPSGAIAPGGRLLPPKGGGIAQGPALSRHIPRAPPIP